MPCAAETRPAKPAGPSGLPPEVTEGHGRGGRANSARSPGRARVYVLTGPGRTSPSTAGRACGGRPQFSAALAAGPGGPGSAECRLDPPPCARAPRSARCSPSRWCSAASAAPPRLGRRAGWRLPAAGAPQVLRASRRRAMTGCRGTAASISRWSPGRPYALPLRDRRLRRPRGRSGRHHGVARRPAVDVRAGGAGRRGGRRGRRPATSWAGSSRSRATADGPACTGACCAADLPRSAVPGRPGAADPAAPRPSGPDRLASAASSVAAQTSRRSTMRADCGDAVRRPPSRRRRPRFGGPRRDRCGRAAMR